MLLSTALGVSQFVVQHSEHGDTDARCQRNFSNRERQFEARLSIPQERSRSVIGVDELTAIVGGPTECSVVGAGSAWLLSSTQRSEFVSGTTFTLLEKNGFA